MRGFGQKIGRTGITATIDAVMAHRALPRQKPSGAGGVPVEDWGAGAMPLPRGLWVERSHRRSVTYKRGSAHSLAVWGIPADSVCCDLRCATVGFRGRLRYFLGGYAMTEVKKLTREELLAAKLQKIDYQRKAVLDQLNRERVRARSKVMGTERKRRSRALILIGASCELAMKADGANVEKVKMLVMKHLTRAADQALVTEYLAGVVSGGTKGSGV